MAYSYQLNTIDFVIKIERVSISPVQKNIELTVSILNLATYNVQHAFVHIEGDDFLAMASLTPNQGNDMYSVIKQAAWSHLLSSEVDMALIVFGRPLEEGETLPAMTEVA
ncbi:MAG TPA: hypothetical protein VIQ81_04195 [Gammaproteobacteria bacterium]